MSLRDTFNNKPWIAYVVAGVFVLIAGVLYLSLRTPTPEAQSPVQPAFYSNDDGKTWFVDSTDKRSSFEKDGKRAYRVYVWKGSDGKEFVSHLEREIAPKAKDGKPIPQQATKGTNLAYATGPREVKKPGAPETAWTPIQSPAGLQIAASPAGAEPVEPTQP
jgi:hypothetical protein